ncbi:MAG TPA: GDSL-type esterase/lipase family protein [Kiritimatiellia bacterium]|nr:GDSL-type esterase/lipase family protein [Kiritimatiellia bacterium]
MRPHQVWMCALGVWCAAQAACAAAAEVTVVNKGFPGRNSRQALALLEREVLPLKPQHAVVFFGMNDAMNSGNLVPLAEFEQNLEALAERLAAGGARTVALVTIHPVIEAYVKERHPKHPQRADMQAWLAAYDQAVRRVAQARKLGLIDWRSRVEKQGGASVSADSLLRCVANGGGRDGVHLTAQAQALLGRCVFEAVGAGVKAGETVVCFGDSLTFGSGVKGAGTTEGEAYPAVLRRLLEQRGRAAAATP